MNARFESYNANTDSGVIVTAVYNRSTQTLIVSCEGYHVNNESNSNYRYRTTHVKLNGFDYRIIVNDVKSFLLQGERDSSMTYDEYDVLNTLYKDMK